MNNWENIVKFYQDCDKWEEMIKSHCYTKEEQEVVSDCFIRMKDRYQNIISLYEEGLSE